MYYIVKILISSAVIATSTEVAKRNPALGGLILALPLVSIISFAFMGFQGSDPTTLTSYAKSTLIFVPISLVFFLPFVLPIFAEWTFIAKFISGLVYLIAINFVLLKLKLL